MLTKTGSTPLISVIMGVYYQNNDVFALARSVDSILKQDFAAFELLICDDGSTQAAKILLDGYARQDSRVRLLRPGDKYKLPDKLNVCLKEARGNFVARMDDDDYSHPDRFKEQLAILRAHQNLSFVGCNVNLVRGGEMIGSRVLPELPQVQDFRFVQPFIHPGLLFRREALLAVGGYSEDRYCELCEDYDLLLRLYAQGFYGMNLQRCLLDYTVSDTARGSRRFRHRWNETVTRYRRFKELKLLPGAFVFVVKPLVVGILPEKALSRLKSMFYHN